MRLIKYIVLGVVVSFAMLSIIDWLVPEVGTGSIKVNLAISIIVGILSAPYLSLKS